MKNLSCWSLVLLLVSQLPTAAGAPVATLKTDLASFTLDDRGSLVAIVPTGSARNLLSKEQPAPLLTLRVAGTLHAPDGAVWDGPSRKLSLRYGALDLTAVVLCEPKPSHLACELLAIRATDGRGQPAEVELALWGPYPVAIRGQVGETVGVVRDAEFAAGIQALNAKTLGGFPAAEHDIDPGFTADDPGDYGSLPEALRKDQLFRGDTARATAFGAVLHAYCRNRSQDRVIANWGHDRYLAPAFADGGVVGSRIALFACPVQEALATLGRIELAEGLPHPMLDGEWAKTARNARCSYLIIDFGESSIDRALEMTRRAGLTYLYHSSPFETWGHFELKPSLFPNGRAGFRTCVEKAAQAGIRIGFHTLSNFITPNDRYVTPEPDPRLARIGETALAADIDEKTPEIPVASPDFFRKKTALNAVRVGAELVRFEAVSGEAPWRLLGCQRGAWGTRPGSHRQGAAVARLMDHDYQVFLSNAELSQAIARNIAAFCNETGARQLSFDGLEGNWSTGMGQYGSALFTAAWYDALQPELRGAIINDASTPGHFNWHVYTRMNWGEPWYAGFRESQTLYRFKNQLYFERNLMPRMLGWFALRAETSLEDAEWLLARAAGFDAGFALAASLASTAQLAADPGSADAARQFGATPAILEAIRQWETARMSGAFPENVRAALRDNEREFQLRPIAAGGWELQEMHRRRFTTTEPTTQPVEFSYENPNPGQALQWRVTNAGKEPLTELVLRVNGRLAVACGPKTIPPGGTLQYRGGTEAVISDAAWREVERLAVDPQGQHASPGASLLRLEGPAAGLPPLKLEIATPSPGTRIAVRRPGF